MNTVVGFIILVLLIATPLAYLTSIGLLWFYRRAVFRAMRKRSFAGTAQTLSEENRTSLEQPVQTTLNSVVLDPHSSPAVISSLQESYRNLLRAPSRAAAIYVLAGLGYAVTFTILYLLSAQMEFVPLRFIVLCWIYAWPIVLTVNLIAAATWRRRLLTISAYFIVLILLDITSAIRNSIDIGQVFQVWFLLNFPATLLLFVLLNRRVRAVGPLVLIVTLFAVTGSLFLPVMIGNYPGLLRLVATSGIALGLDASGTLIGLNLLGLILFGIIGWLLLPVIVMLYKRKKINDQSIIIDSIWLLFSADHTIDITLENGAWFFAGLLAFLVYRMIVFSGFSLSGFKNPSAQKTPTLLLLRVFSLGKRSERLFDALTLYWRYTGSVQLIAGPDLVTTTVKPHEFLDFLSGKLARRFIDRPETLDLRISEMDLQPDQDGRFRVNDFFCYDDTWRMVLSRLIHESDVVLMDLRGFSRQNAGCVFEINELINVMPMRQVLFVTDHTTDEAFLREIMQESWQHMRPSSPNRLSTSGDLHLFHLKNLSHRELQRFLTVLFMVANAKLETSTVMPPV